MACTLGLDDDAIAIRKRINATRCHNVFAKGCTCSFMVDLDKDMFYGRKSQRQNHCVCKDVARLTFCSGYYHTCQGGQLPKPLILLEEFPGSHLTKVRDSRVIVLSGSCPEAVSSARVPFEAPQLRLLGVGKVSADPSPPL